VVPSTIDTGQEGNFWLSFYFDCDDHEISFEGHNMVDPRYETIIEEEDMKDREIDEELFKALKLKTLAVLLEEDRIHTAQINIKQSVLMGKSVALAGSQLAGRPVASDVEAQSVIFLGD
jgi:hypothetical protein